MRSAKLLQAEDFINRFIETGNALMKEPESGLSERDRSQFAGLMEVIKLITLSKIAMEDITDMFNLDDPGGDS